MTIDSSEGESLSPEFIPTRISKAPAVETRSSLRLLITTNTSVMDSTVRKPQNWKLPSRHLPSLVDVSLSTDSSMPPNQFPKVWAPRRLAQLPSTATEVELSILTWPLTSSCHPITTHYRQYIICNIAAASVVFEIDLYTRWEQAKSKGHVHRKSPITRATKTSLKRAVRERCPTITDNYSGLSTQERWPHWRSIEPRPLSIHSNLHPIAGWSSLSKQWPQGRPKKEIAFPTQSTMGVKVYTAQRGHWPIFPRPHFDAIRRNIPIWIGCDVWSGHCRTQTANHTSFYPCIPGGVATLGKILPQIP